MLKRSILKRIIKEEILKESSDISAAWDNLKNSFSAVKKARQAKKDAKRDVDSIKDMDHLAELDGQINNLEANYHKLAEKLSQFMNESVYNIDNLLLLENDDDDYEYEVGFGKRKKKETSGIESASKKLYDTLCRVLTSAKQIAKGNTGAGQKKLESKIRSKCEDIVKQCIIAGSQLSEQTKGILYYIKNGDFQIKNWVNKQNEKPKKPWYKQLFGESYQQSYNYNQVYNNSSVDNNRETNNNINIPIQNEDEYGHIKEKLGKLNQAIKTITTTYNNEIKTAIENSNNPQQQEGQDIEYNSQEEVWPSDET